MGKKMGKEIEIFQYDSDLPEKWRKVATSSLSQAPPILQLYLFICLFFSFKVGFN